jgi:hypothetical protein
VRRLPVLLLLGTLGVLAGCQIGPVGANKPYWPVDSVRILVPTDPVPVGERHIAYLVGRAECPPRHVPVSWRVSDTSLVGLSQPTCNQVTLVGKRPGRAELSVTVASQTGRTPVFVGQQPAVARIRVRPMVAWVRRGDTLRLVATPLDSLGRPLPATFLAWSFGDGSLFKLVGVPRVGEIVVVAAQPGRTRAYAELGGRSASNVIQIGAATSPSAVAAVRLRPSSRRLRVGDTVAFQADVQDEAGARLPGRRVVWSVSDPGILKLWSFAPLASQRISYRAALPGTVLVAARSGGVEDTVRLVVACPGQPQESSGASLRRHSVTVPPGPRMQPTGGKVHRAFKGH